MISYQEALSIILSTVKLPAVQTVPLAEALGKVSVGSVHSPLQVPSFRNSAMDGFAVKASLLAEAGSGNPITLTVDATIAAGDRPSYYNSNHAVQIMTGAPVPEEFDAVVPVEMVSQRDGYVTFHKPVSSGENVRHAGEDVLLGDEVLSQGETVTPEKIMLLSALGLTSVEIASIPPLQIISTGNEIVDDYHTPLNGAQIYNSSAPFLLASARAQGLDASYKGKTNDTPALFENVLKSITAPSIIISTGAVSKGVWDFIPDTLRKNGASIYFHRVNIRPGKPVLFATLPDGSYYFGLPGNPISTVIGFTFFVVPLIRALQGKAPLPPLMAKLESNFIKKGDFVQYLKAVATVDAGGQLRAALCEGQESFKIKSLTTSNAWVILEGNTREWKIGDNVQLHPYGVLHGKVREGEPSACQAA